MNMIFWWDHNLENYLIFGFNIRSIGGLVGLCILVTIFSIGFEWVQYLQKKQHQLELLRANRGFLCSIDSKFFLRKNIKHNRAAFFGTKVTLWFFLQSFGNILMLSAMLYNGWLFISCIIGGGIGYFVFGQKLMKVNMRNCQMVQGSICMAVRAKLENKEKENESTAMLEQSSTSSESEA